MTFPTVSVILVVRNGARFIADALDSVLLSEIQPLEIVVVDGGSTDDTLAIARRAPLVRVAEQLSTSVADAFNIGIAASRGDLISFNSYDDLWLPGKLDRQAHYMAEHPELLYTVSHVQYFLHDGAEIPPGFRRELLDAPVVAVIPEGLMARRAAFDVVGKFDVSYPVGEDTEWFARAKDMGAPMAVLPDVLVRKRIHGNNWSLSSPINHLLLRALRSSVERKRASASAEPS